MARLIVTLPPQLGAAEALAFAKRAAAAGAELLELRTDLHLDGVGPDVKDLAELIGLLCSERGRPIPRDWRDAASEIDSPVWPSPQGHLGNASVEKATVLSFHADSPLSTEEVERLWALAPPSVVIKHVEPVGEPSDAARLLETQRRLFRRHGSRITVLASGSLALPFRAVLATGNALDYLALDTSWSAVPGQRLLADAVRARKARPGSPRRGILGSGIAHSRSPRIHPQPFDRIDLPPDAEVEALIEALHPHYLGLAVTSPFKRKLAAYLGGTLPAINTLVRTRSGWSGHNTDVAGARAVLERLASPMVTAIGDGGTTAAIRQACDELGIRLDVRRREEIRRGIDGPSIWTWPDSIAPPPALRFSGAPVAVIAYGPPAWRIRQQVVRLGGSPRMLGPSWFIAQARGQRRLWEDAR